VAAAATGLSLHERLTVRLTVDGAHAGNEDGAAIHGTLVAKELILAARAGLERLGWKGNPDAIFRAEGLSAIGTGSLPTRPLGGETGDLVLLTFAESTPAELTPRFAEDPLPLTGTPPTPAVGFMFQILRLMPGGTPDAHLWPVQYPGLTTAPGGLRMRLDPQTDPPLPFGLEGAPLILDDKVAGIVVTDATDTATGERELLAVPIQEILTSEIGRVIRLRRIGFPNFVQATDVEQSPEVELDERRLLSLLSDPARSVLAIADHVRSDLDDAEMSSLHLTAGLYLVNRSELKAQLDAAGVSQEQLRQVLEVVGTRDVPLGGSFDGATLTAIPRCSRNARFALFTALRAGAAEARPAVQSRHLLHGLLNTPASAVVRALLAWGMRTPLTDASLPPRLPIAGFRPDGPTGADLLGIANDVEALSSLLAARDVAMPLSIGLFGDWGSGKSFFMEQMRTRIGALIDGAKADLDAGRETPYCTTVVQLQFNAWHYADTSLWGSLADEIFEGLAEKVKLTQGPAAGLTDLEYQRERLAADAAAQRAELDAAEQALSVEKSNLQAVTVATAAEIRSVDALADTLTPQVLMQGTANVLLQQQEVKDALGEAQKQIKHSLNAAADAVNLPKDQRSTEAAQKRLLELGGFRDALVLAITNRRQRTLWIWAIVAALIIIGIVALLGAARPVLTNLLGEMGSSLLTVATLVGGIIAAIGVVVGPYVGPACRAIVLVRQVKAENARLLEAERAGRLAEIKKKQDEAEAQFKAAEATVKTKRQAAEKTDEEIEKLKADRQLRDFVKRRHDSDDYRRLRGEIGQARSDFEQLDLLLRQERRRVEERDGATPDLGPDGKPKSLLPTLERIVLYIDDLDRCPDDKVMQVLQAVHLLLAFPIFAVVVAVDPRWLLYSVRQHSAAFRPDENEADDLSPEERAHWRSTPLTYLEKVFQIPFTLRPMRPDGFGKMIEALAAPMESAAHHVTDVNGTATFVGGASGENAGDATAGADGQGPNGIAATVTDEPSPDQTRRDKATRNDASDPSDATPAIELGTRHLEIEEHEREVMKELHLLIPSPRAAKRFVNVYRLFKAKVEPNAEDFEKLTRPGTGDYRAALVLLAILTGFPEQATEILRDLIKPGAEPRLWPFLEKYRPAPRRADDPAGADDRGRTEYEESRWNALFAILEQYREPLGSGEAALLPKTALTTAFVQWAPEVARYSFQSGRVLIAG
jgi:hypothetical protein